jgi:acetyl-CoA carboxylase alpha subunit
MQDILVSPFPRHSEPRSTALPLVVFICKPGALPTIVVERRGRGDSVEREKAKHTLDWD